MKKSLRIVFVCIIAIVGCKKQNDWLDAKRQTSDNVPKTLKDFQAIMDNSLVMNTNYPTIGLLGADNYFLSDNIIASSTVTERNSYLWKKDIFENTSSLEYTFAYNIIAHANIILDGLEAIDKNKENIIEYNNIKGQALFFRTMMFFELSSLFCKSYDKITAATDPGICTRTKSDIHHIEPRSSVEQTYSLMINNLTHAFSLLPVIPTYKTRPSKPAAFALLAKVYLQMGEYVIARNYADSTLTYFNSILDYNSNSVSINKPYRFPDFSLTNKEIIFYATGIRYVSIVPSASTNTSYVDSLLYQSYDENDLRKVLLFSSENSGKVKFRGSYTGNDLIFSGISVNDIYLIRAECNARLNNVISATQDLNRILVNRFKKGTYTDFSTSIPDTALAKILDERRKEFPFSGQIRWQDLRRLNKEQSFAKVLNRFYIGVLYELMPNDKRYVYPFPQNEIDLTGIQQNVR